MDPTQEPTSLKTSDIPGFRRLRAKQAALVMHHKNPEVAKNAGRKGGEATASSFPGGKKAWALEMARRRWYPKPAVSASRSRAPEAGSGSDGDGTPESGPAAARSKRSQPRKNPPKNT